MKTAPLLAREFPVGQRVRLADLARNPYPVLKRLQQEEPVSWIEELQLWFVTRRADVDRKSTRLNSSH